MKKIIATVLAMVMALALCTTAFAAGWTKTLYTKADDTEYKYYAAVDATCTTKGHGAYYTTYSDDEDAIVYYRDAFTSEKSSATVVVFKGMTSAAFLIRMDSADEKLGYVTPVYGHDLSELSADETATCTKDAYKAGTFKCADCGKYFYVSDGTAAGDIKNYKPDGLTVGSYNEIDKAVEMDANMIWASHVLYPVPYTYDEMGQPVYKCVVCGEEVAALPKNDTNIELFKTLYGVDALNFYDATSAVVADWCTENATEADLKDIVYGQDDDMVYVTVKAAASTGTAGSTTATSPKTFDAGIAMYVGMALTSVAGSAVVIGKKKEF